MTDLVKYDGSKETYEKLVGEDNWKAIDLKDLQPNDVFRAKLDNKYLLKAPDGRSFKKKFITHSSEHAYAAAFRLGHLYVFEWILED